MLRTFSQLSTVVGVETVAGQIVGTPPYMSPEQARGEEVDQRTDVWAFGCLLYELLAGKRAFRGETLSETLRAIFEREPDWNALPAKTPAKIRSLLRKCLDKNATSRLQDIRIARDEIRKAQHGFSRWQLAAGAAAAVAVLAIGAALWLRSPTRPPGRDQWVPLTKLPDSVSQPALSADGRMLTFVRGPSTFFGPGQVYVKILPDGEPVQLTNDSLYKMSPAFSPDGSRIAYTTVDLAQFHWDTWIVPVLGGPPQPWLSNASGLVWSGPHQVLFSEVRRAPHMGIMAAEESRVEAHDVYLPTHERGMAHRSYASPDGKSVLLVEMDKDGAWLPCRLVPEDGSSPGRQIGPASAGCTSGAWSSDGKWMYVTSDAGGMQHIWRQRFPDGRPEQITSGPTEEEGVAMAPDGHSFVTAMGVSTVSQWLHDAKGERQISRLEGAAAYPQFTPDGKKLCYVMVKEAPNANEPTEEPGELWVADLESGRSERLVPGFEVLSYSVSPDGQQVAMGVADREGRHRLWLAPLDRRSPPRQIPNVEGMTPLWGLGGEIFFRRTEGTSSFVYRVRPDGTGMRKAVDQPMLWLNRLTPGSRSLVAWATFLDSKALAWQAFPLDGGPPVLISAFIVVDWSPGGHFVSFSGGLISAGKSYVIPLPPGEDFPPIPAGGFRSEEQVAKLPGAHRINVDGVVPGVSPDVYVFSRGTTQRNLYRIPIP
jgi:eukaryotic-like serine/threonine-protein kinase